jgi:hypothetical protein
MNDFTFDAYLDAATNSGWAACAECGEWKDKRLLVECSDNYLRCKGTCAPAFEQAAKEPTLDVHLEWESRDGLFVAILYTMQPRDYFECDVYTSPGWVSAYVHAPGVYPVIAAPTDVNRTVEEAKAWCKALVTAILTGQPWPPHHRLPF